MQRSRMVYVLTMVCVLSTGVSALAEKIPVKTLDDLPRHTYPIEGTVSGMLRSPDQFQAFAAAVRADLESDLDTYAIEDASTLQGMYGSLLTLDIMDHAHASARTRIEQIRALEDKEAKRLTTGLTALAVMRAREETGDADGDAYLAAFESHLRTQLAVLPWDVISTRITQQKGRVEILGEALLLGMVKGQLDPIVASSLEVSSDLAGQVLNLGYALQYALPLKQPMLKVYGELISGRTVIKPDIWAARDLVLTEAMGLEPVVIAVWDSGVDMPVFTGQRFVNAGEAFDGRDTDGNGFIDDVHGIAYTYQGLSEPHLLYPLGAAADRIERALDHMKGMMDLQAAIDSPEASDLRAYIGGLDTDAVNVFLEDMTICSLYAHGTHVAGISVRGNPYARLLCARISFDYHSVPELLTEEMARNHAASYGETVAYFKIHGVRVANMSWGWGLKEIEGILEANGWGDGAEARSLQARRILDILKEGLYEAIAGSPDILFVSAAGNDDNDVAFDEFIPSSFDLPNLMIVGAVDQAGEATGFTSSGDNVRIYANGFEVMSSVPGGREMALSGTSMASPNVCNLAAKLFAIAPDLTPVQVVKLIVEGADPGDGFLLMNPKRSASLLDR